MYLYKHGIHNHCTTFLRRYFSKNVEPKITIPQGKLRGSIAADVDGNQYYKFQGIPYAKPPLGKLRFRAPETPEQWHGTLDATKEGNSCYSRHPFKASKIVGNENCLNLNVYTKNIKEKTLKPVMFWIFGGGFMRGLASEEIFGSDFLITEDVVIVTVNYRLGFLGFLSLEDSSLHVPGNAGLKDLVMALKWVQTNIDNFGGDPNNVTIFGQSSGAATVQLLMLSQLSRGLFHKAIAQSGSALNPLARAKRDVSKISSLLGCENSEREVYRRFMNIPVEELYKIQENVDDILQHVPSLQRQLGYIVEPPYEKAFLSKNPLDIITQGNFEQVPFLIGHTNSESLTFCILRKRTWPGFHTCEDMISYDLGYKVGSSQSETVAEEMRKFYFGSKDLAVDNFQKLQMESDMIFNYGIYLSVMKHFQKSKVPIYVYRMSVDTKLNLSRQLLKYEKPGVIHSDDLGYLFKNFTTPKIVQGSKEDIGMRRFVGMWTNFAKYGNPKPFDDSSLSVTWKPVTNEEIDFLDIGDNLIVSSNSDELRRVKFLQSLFEKYPPS